MASSSVETDLSNLLALLILSCILLLGLKPEPGTIHSSHASRGRGLMASEIVRPMMKTGFRERARPQVPPYSSNMTKERESTPTSRKDELFAFRRARAKRKSRHA
jgi:hypothetical protein